MHERTAASVVLRVSIALAFAAGAMLALSGCITVGTPARPEYQKNGVQYGITKGLFRGRWWNYYERGRSYADGAFWEEAERDFRVALMQREQDQLWTRTYGIHFLPEYFPHRELGVVLYEQGRFEESFRELELSLAQRRSARAVYYLQAARRDYVLAGGLDAAAPTVEAAVERSTGPQGESRFVLKGIAQDDTFVSELFIDGKPVDLLAQPPGEGARFTGRSVPFSAEIDVAAGSNALALRVVDILGKEQMRTIEAQADLDGPVIAFARPVQLPGTVRGTLRDASGVASLSIGGQAARVQTLPDGSATFEVTLAPANVTQGPILFTAKDQLGNLNTGPLPLDTLALPQAALPVMHAGYSLASEIAVRLQEYRGKWWLVAQAPSQPLQDKLELRFPGLREGQRFRLPELALQVRIRAAAPLASVEIDGREAEFMPEALEQDVGRNVRLVMGENTIVVRVRDTRGNVAEQRVTVLRVPGDVDDERAQMHALLAGTLSEGNPATLPDESNFVLGETESAMATQGRFVLVERDALRSVLEEQNLVALLGDEESRVGLGALARADLLLFGRIHRDHQSIEVVLEGVNAATGVFVARADVAGKGDTADDVAQLCTVLSSRMAQAFPKASGALSSVAFRRQAEGTRAPRLAISEESWREAAALPEADWPGFFGALRAELQAAAPLVLLDRAHETDLALEEALPSDGPAKATLQSDYLLTGSIAVVEGAPRLLARLVKVSDQAILWTFEPKPLAPGPGAMQEAAAQLAKELAAAGVLNAAAVASQQEAWRFNTTLGARDGLVPYTSCVVFRNEGEDRDPVTGQLLGHRMSLLGDAYLEQVQADSSAGTFIHEGPTGTGALTNGDVLLTR